MQAAITINLVALTDVKWLETLRNQAFIKDAFLGLNEF